jgi:hypothetical protein
MAVPLQTPSLAGGYWLIGYTGIPFALVGNGSQAIEKAANAAYLFDFII